MTLPVLELPPRRSGPDRRVDRRLAFAGLVVAGAFLAAALASLLLPAGVRLGWWLPLHLALAGAAGTAIAAMLPFFVAALTVAPPAPAVVRGTAIALVALGAGLAAAGRAGGATIPNPIAAAGAVAYVAGAAMVVAAAGLSLRGATGPRRPATELAYVVALANVAIGAAIAGLYLLGSPEVVGRWAELRAAHAWLNTFGFVGLVVAGTLLHFAPTVAGSRIRRRRAGAVAVAGLALGPVTVAAGYGLALDEPVLAGALVTLAGSVGLAVHGLQAHRDAAGWSTEAPWHRYTGGSLLAAPGWLVVAATIAVAATAGTAVAGAGADPRGWRIEPIAAPLVAGFVVQVLLGALAHLVPAIGPGGPERHAAARRILGREATIRLLGWNAGVAALTVGLLGGPTILVPVGGTLLVTTLGATLLLLGLCLRDRG